jgi:hypothetical protein
MNVSLPVFLNSGKSFTKRAYFLLKTFCFLLQAFLQDFPSALVLNDKTGSM